jgi:hypothetical protein
VFLNSPHRETPKNVKKNREKVGFGFLVEFFREKKLFDTIFLQNVFCSVFELPSLKNTRKRDKTKKVEEKLTSNFLSKIWKYFSTWTFCKNIFMVFLNSPCREAPKNVLKKKPGKKSRVVGGWVWDLANVRGGPSIFFLPAPRQGAKISWTADCALPADGCPCLNQSSLSAFRPAAAALSPPAVPPHCLGPCQ